MRSTLLTCLFMVIAAFQSACALGDQVEVNLIQARQRYPWNGLVDIDFTVTGIPKGPDHYVPHLVVTNRDTSAACPVHSLAAPTRISSNGTYRLTWDAAADLGKVRVTNLAAYVELSKIKYKGVQLWEDGPYWAETNVGAENPWDAGLYFWWGDTNGYKRVDGQWVSSDGSVTGFSFDRENTPTYRLDDAALKAGGWINDAGVLTPAHDAAHAHWGGNWRMPTEVEIQALVDNTEQTWIETNGVHGYLVKGKGAYSPASIFLPASGCGNGGYLYDSGSRGHCWSSPPIPGYSLDAWDLYFYSGHFLQSGSNRYSGQTVRPLSGFAE